jgi:hypothetical protein
MIFTDIMKFIHASLVLDSAICVNSFDCAGNFSFLLREQLDRNLRESYSTGSYPCMIISFLITIFSMLTQF